jgi:hypothetical protein
VYGSVLGLGALPKIPENADFNDYKNYGVYAVTQNTIATTLKNCPEQKAGTLRVWAATGNGYRDENYAYVIQEYISYYTARSYRRTMTKQGKESAWEFGDWIDMNGRAIVSQGTTDGWTWVKYADGTAECWRRVSQTADITTSWSNIYYGNCQEVVFPFSFYSAPVVNASVESGYGMWLMSWAGSDSSGTALANKPASLRVVRPTSTAAASFIIAYHAIGRWK